MLDSNLTFDGRELMMRIFKYIFEGIVVAVAAFLIPGRPLPLEQVITIGIVAAATFSVLDLFAPSMSQAVRFGSAVTVGSNLVGGFSNPIPLSR